MTFLGDTERSYIDGKVKADCAKCCELLGLDVGLFEKDTTVRRIVTSEGEMLLNLSREQVGGSVWITHIRPISSLHSPPSLSRD